MHAIFIKIKFTLPIELSRLKGNFIQTKTGAITKGFKDKGSKIGFPFKIPKPILSNRSDSSIR